MNEEYTLDYFISMFSMMDASWFSLSTEPEQLDAYNWLSEEEQEALYKIVKPWGILTDVNDGIDGYDLYGETIKERILNFLNHIKDNRFKYFYY